MSKLYNFYDGSSNIDIIDLFSTSSGNSNINNYGNYCKQFDLFNDIQSANTLLNINSNVNYKNNNTDFVRIFNPKNIDYISSNFTNGTGTVSIPIPLWVNKVGFIIQANGGNGGISYTDSWQSSTQNSSTSYYQIINYTANRYYNNNSWNMSRYLGIHHGQIAGYSQGSTTSYGRTYSTSTQNYCGSSGGGGGCIAGVYNTISGRTYKNNNSLSMTIGFNVTSPYDNTKKCSYIQFNDNTTNPSLSIANNGTNYTANTSLTQNTTDTYGLLGYSYHYSQNSSFISDLNTKTKNLSNSGSFLSIFHSAGNSGSTGSAGGTSVVGGSSGYFNYESIKTSFYPNINTSYGNGGIGTNTSSVTNGNGGIIRYWFIR